MTKTSGLLGKFTRAFWLQVGLITIAAILGVFLAKITIEETLVRKAILEEAEYFWKYHLGDNDFNLPDTKNLTGYLDSEQLPPVVQDNLPNEPGFYEYADLSNRLVLYLSKRQQETLYLIYYRGQVDALVLYYGLFPLLVVLTILYLTLWLAYLFSRRAISPLTRLANQINEIDFSVENFSQTFETDYIQSDDEIQILSNAIAHLGERLDAFVARERNFTRNASHEFRTPLTVIKVAADMMMIENRLTEKSQQSLLKIKRAVNDMESLTEVFLMLAREDTGSVTRREVDVNQIMRGQIERSEILKENKNIQINLFEKTQLRVHASETVIAVLLGNLIRNAILYTEKGEIKIEIDADHLTIIDSGPGIPQSSINNIFEPFQRASNENASGYGIGLTIVKRLCDRFHWDIEVSSAAEQGSCFRLRFDKGIE